MNAREATTVDQLRARLLLLRPPVYRDGPEMAGTTLSGMAEDAKQPTQGADDMKAKMREALERKKAAASGHGPDASVGGKGKAGHEQGAAGGKREFRRKSS